MAAATDKNRCAVCNKGKATLRCGGCLREFCFNHVTDHRQELCKQLDEVEVTRDLFRQTLTEQKSQPQKHPYMQEIDKWERESIDKIQQTAKEARQLLIQHIPGHIAEIEIQLNKLTGQLRKGREEDDFFETDLSRWKKEITQLTGALNKSSNIRIRQDSAPFVTKIVVDVPKAQLYTLKTDANTKRMQNGITVAGGNGCGSRLNQFNRPWNIYVDDRETIYVADCANNRIVKWNRGEITGKLVAGGNEQGSRTDQLNKPTAVVVDKRNGSLIICDSGNRRVVRWSRENSSNGQVIISDVNSWDLAVDNAGYLYVSDYAKHEVRRWRIGDSYGTVVAGGNGKGNRFDQLDYPTHIFVDQHHSVYVSDTNNDRVMKWIKGAKEGIVVASDQGKGTTLTQLSSPRGIYVDQSETIYVAEYNSGRVTRWPKGAAQGSIVVGGNGAGSGANQLSNPMGISLDEQGNFYVVDYGNYRVKKFNIDSKSTS